jgi:cytochrome c oxidase cbb3-type subunit 3
MAQLGRVAGWLVAIASAGAAAACDRAPSAQALPEWTPADHHSSDDDKVPAAMRAQAQGQAQAQSAKGGGAGAKAGGDPAQVAQLVDITWRQQCSNCHGSAGRGDGQMGPMLHATDLTDAAWQGRTSDAAMVAVIKNGKNRMPRFDLPDAVVDGLVTRIRALRASP